MALAQQITSPSSFYSSSKGLTNIIPFPSQESQNNFSSSGITIFNKDNQRPTVDYSPNANIWFPYSLSQVKLIELDEYKGFYFVECGKISVSYNKDKVKFLRDFKFVLLNRKEHNDYYPDPYLIICYELELEGIGKTKDEALSDLNKLLDIYFNRTQEVYKKPDEYENAIMENINQQNSWKQSFDRTYERARRLELIIANYQYNII